MENSMKLNDEQFSQRKDTISVLSDEDRLERRS